MTDVLAAIEHHPAITALIVSGVFAFFGLVGWAINYFKGTKATNSLNNVSVGRDFISAGRDVIVADHSKVEDTEINKLKLILKEFALFLDEFGDNLIVSKTYNEFLFRMKNYNVLFRNILAGLHSSSLILQQAKNIHSNIQNFLNQPLKIDGGRSWAKQIEYINNCKKHANQAIEIIEGTKLGC